MKKYLTSGLSALALACCAFCAQAATVPGVQVTLDHWAFGNGVAVQATGYSGQAGGFGGVLSGTNFFDSTNFLTYCIELEEGFGFSATPMAGYAVQEGRSYFERRRGDEAIADRLGRLLTWVHDHPTQVDGAAESAALQLAIWNLVYDDDYTLGKQNGAGGGDFKDKSDNRLQANVLLEGAKGVVTSRYSVYTLEAKGSQDFLLLKENTPVVTATSTSIPEPGSLGLVAAALAGLTLLRRSRRA